MRNHPLRQKAAAFLCGILMLHPLPVHADEAEAPQFESIPVSGFRVGCVIPQEKERFGTLEWWYSEWDDCRYLFLPATADRSKLTVTFELDDEDATLTLNGRPVYSGYETAVLSTADVFTVEVNDEFFGELRVMQSDRSSIWFSLEEGGLETLDTRKDTPVTAEALMLNADGSVEYEGAIERLKGRGNSSWDYSLKKPFNFKLPKKAPLYGMGSAKKWALLSNYLDHSMLRNEIAFSMARQSGLPFTSDAVFVDLYMDGDYRGTYQLSERVLVHKQRVNIQDLQEATEAVNPQPLEDYPLMVSGGTHRGEEPGSYQYFDIPNDPADITGGYLFQFQLFGRSERAEFVTSRGQICDITAPENPTRSQTEYLRRFMQDLEDAVYSESGYNGKGKHYSDYLDVDSLVLGYLIQEITENSDGASTSFYFYKDSDLTGDGKLHYGPVWDFDLSIRNYSLTQEDMDGNKHYAVLSDNLYAPFTNRFLETFWRKNEIGRRAAVLYAERFDNFLTVLTQPGQPESSLIAQMHTDLSASAEMNLVRWHMYGGRPYKPLGPTNGYTYAECVEYVRRFLEDRQAYLQKEFLRISRERCTAALEAAAPADGYDPAEQAQINALRKEHTALLSQAETAASAEALLTDALAAAEQIPKTELSGDFNVNGAVSLDDAQAVLRYYTLAMGGQKPHASATQLRNGDVDKNGKIILSDAMHILSYYTAKLGGLDYTLPVAAKGTASEQEAPA